MPEVRDAVRMGEEGAEFEDWSGSVERKGGCYQVGLGAFQYKDGRIGEDRGGWGQGSGDIRWGCPAGTQRGRRVLVRETKAGALRLVGQDMTDYQCYDTGSDCSGQTGRGAKVRAPLSPPSATFFLFSPPLLFCKAFHLFLISLPFPKALQLRHLRPSGCLHWS